MIAVKLTYYVHPEPKLMFDAMTIVGNLSKNNAQKLSEFMSVKPQIKLLDMLQPDWKTIERTSDSRLTPISGNYIKTLSLNSY